MEELFAWQQFGFPKPSRTLRITAFASWRVRTAHEWDIWKLDQFDAQIRDLAAETPRK